MTEKLLEIPLILHILSRGLPCSIMLGGLDFSLESVDFADNNCLVTKLAKVIIRIYCFFHELDALINIKYLREYLP